MIADAEWPDFREALTAGMTDRVSHDQIDRLFRAAQPHDAAAVSLAEERVGRQVAEPVRAQIAFALDRARSRGFLKEFAYRLVDGLDASGQAVERVRELMDPGVPADRVRFEALANMLTGFAHPAEIAHGMQRGRLNTCMIEVRGANEPKRGTGFLLRADLVLTSFHIFEGSGCLERRNSANGRSFAPAQDARARITVIFNNYRDPTLGERAQGLGEAVELAEDWLVAASGIDRIDAANLDYVLIRLRTCPPTLPRGLEPAGDDFPKTAGDRAQVHLFQHPHAAPIRVATGTIAAEAPALARLGLNVNALEGTSGGPYTDRNFRVFALHQGALKEQGVIPGLDDAVNVGVPLSAILRDAGPWPPPGILPRAFTAAGPTGRQPLIGREGLRDWAARALAADGPRVLVVSPIEPHPRPRKFGLTFSAKVLEALLPESEHEIRRLGEEDGWHAMEPLRFCEALLGAPPGTSGLTPMAGAHTTRDKWLTGRLLDDLREAMRARLARGDAGGRLFWLVLDDLDRTEIPDQTGLREFLLALYAEAARGDWLRVVLLGYRGPPLDQAAYRTETEDLWALSPEAVMTYLFELARYLEVPQTAELVDKWRSRVATAFKVASSEDVWRVVCAGARNSTHALATFIDMYVELALAKRRAD